MLRTEPNQDRPGSRAVFSTTLWSVVLSAREAKSPDAHEALDQLCRHYWFPIYAFLRRHGHAPADAEDLAQGFFASLLRHESLASVDPSRGRFRSFLLAALRKFLSDERDRAQALKRGGGRVLLSLDADTAEAHYARQVADRETPEACFERQWAAAGLRRAQEKLRQECEAAGKGALYAALGPQTLGEQPESYADIAARLGLSENAVRVAAFRLRRRYQELVRNEVRQTVARPEDVDDEIRYLLRVLSEAHGVA